VTSSLYGRRSPSPNDHIIPLRLLPRGTCTGAAAFIRAFYRAGRMQTLWAAWLAGSGLRLVTGLYRVLAGIIDGMFARGAKASLRPTLAHGTRYVFCSSMAAHSQLVRRAHASIRRSAVPAGPQSRRRICYRSAIYSTYVGAITADRPSNKIALRQDSHHSDTVRITAPMQAGFGRPRRVPPIAPAGLGLGQ